MNHVISFDEWIKDNYPELLKNQGPTLSICMGFAKDGYEAGAQSRQAEIDELQNRIDEALDAFEDGSFNYCQQILKGKENEH